MGHSTWADVVPFVAHNIIEMSHYDSPDSGEKTPDEIKLICADMYIDGEWCESDSQAAEINPHNVTLNGWLYDRDDKHGLHKIGKKGRLYGHVWIKDSHSVVLVNESEYSNIGDYDIAACANRRIDLEKFLEDMNLTNKIEENDSVQQSG